MPTGIYKRKFKLIIKAGDKFNRLTAIDFHHRNKYGQQFWLFRCDCGNKKVLQVNNVKNGTTRSCGCLNRELSRKRIIEIKTTHGMTYSPEYKTWNSMKNRCYNKNSEKYKYWGKRGIIVCEQWKNSFENFYADMGNRPKGKTLDRIDNSGNYEPSNCRWATAKEQANNMRSNHWITYNGKTLTMAQWASKIGISNEGLYNRLKYGWSIEKSLTTPLLR